ncbi:DUF3011 domain-containing protein [bacterium]|nr:MAG: DUF3011 domain-containing protein [bacterium]
MNIHQCVASVAGLSLMGTLAFAQFGPTRLKLESNDGRRVTRSVENSGVRLVRQISKKPCIEGRTWGYSSTRIWVDDGCRAEFAITPANYNRRQGPGARRERNPNNGRGYGVGTVETVRLESNSGRRETRYVGTDARVRLTRQLSKKPCRQGRSWGVDSNGRLWVDDGCRAEFSVRRRP